MGRLHSRKVGCEELDSSASLEDEEANDDYETEAQNMPSSGSEDEDDASETDAEEKSITSDVDAENEGSDIAFNITDEDDNNKSRLEGENEEGFNAPPFDNYADEDELSSSLSELENRYIPHNLITLFSKSLLG